MVNPLGLSLRVLTEKLLGVRIFRYHTADISLLIAL